MSYLVKKVPMENESNFSLGGTIILLALFAQKYRGEHCFENLCVRYERNKELEFRKCHFACFDFLQLDCYTPLYEKDTKQMQNRPMETTAKPQQLTIKILTFLIS